MNGLERPLRMFHLVEYVLYPTIVDGFHGACRAYKSSEEPRR